MLKNMLLLCTILLINLTWIVVQLSSNHFTPISTMLSKTTRTNVSTLLPQGWSFFTRDPQEIVTSVNVLDPIDSTFTNEVIKNASSRNFFGLKRYSNIQMAELSDLEPKVPEPYWKECETYDCLDNLDDLIAFNINNNSDQQMICGTIYLVKEKPVPWAYTKLVKHEGRTTKLKIAKINSICN